MRVQKLINSLSKAGIIALMCHLESTRQSGFLYFERSVSVVFLIVFSLKGLMWY